MMERTFPMVATWGARAEGAWIYRQGSKQRKTKEKSIKIDFS